MSLLLLVVSALHILILILLFVATLDKVSLLQPAGIFSCRLPPHPSSKVPRAPPLFSSIFPSEVCL